MFEIFGARFSGVGYLKNELSKHQFLGLDFLKLSP
jgi:hypothetical protein